MFLIMIEFICECQETPHLWTFIGALCCAASRVRGFVQLDLLVEFGLCVVFSDSFQPAWHGISLFVESHPVWWPQLRLNLDVFQMNNMQLTYFFSFQMFVLRLYVLC